MLENIDVALLGAIPSVYAYAVLCPIPGATELQACKEKALRALCKAKVLPTALLAFMH